MNKKVFERINLTCVFQNTNSFGISKADTTAGNNKVFNGMISSSGDGNVLFQETVTRKRDVRNTRLFEGEYMNLVRRKDGCYYPCMKSFRPEDIKDKSELAFRIYNEIVDALNLIE